MALMPVNIETAASPQAADAGRAQPWPSRASAYYALGIIVLATLLNFMDGAAFNLMIERIRVDFSLTDTQLGWLLGPANIVFYIVVLMPMARLVDKHPRKIILAIGMVLTTGFTALGGLTQSFWQLFGTRMMAGAGGSAHAPGAYSMLADLFPPARLPRAIAVIQLGFIGGTTIGVLLAGHALALVAGWQPTQFMGLTILGWQWVLLAFGLPGLILAALLLLIREPARRGTTGKKPEPMPLGTVLSEIRARKLVYLPLFIGLALSALESQGLAAWRVPLLVRDYGWDERDIGNWSAPIGLVTSLLGLLVGTATTEWLEKRHKDANVRTTTIMFSLAVPCAVAAPLMPNGLLCLILYSLGGMFGIASAIPQNAAIQRITPNMMRGQVTAIYLFMYTVFGALGSLVIGMVNQHVIGGEHGLWRTMAITAALLMPTAAFVISRGIRPYRIEVERIEALEGRGGPA